jgi:hypothetical protein
LEASELPALEQRCTKAKARIGTVAEVAADPETASFYERVSEALRPQGEP